MTNRIKIFRRIFRRSPKLAFIWLTRKTVKTASKLIPNDEWKVEWLGEEMRPFNSLQRREPSA